MKKVLLLGLMVWIVAITSCNKSDEALNLATIKEYAPLTVGKYITYNLDSLVFKNFGTKDTVIKYQVKLVVDAEITDNLGRPAFRIIRYIRKTAANPWNPDNTFMAVQTEFGFEFVENNLRFLKLKAPVRDGASWKGNSYIDTYSLASTLKYLDDWDYTFDSVNVKQTLGGFSFDSTLKVNQRYEIEGDLSVPPINISLKDISFEKYAKGVGLIYREFLHTEFQPAINGAPVGHYTDDSYGVKMTIIDHN
jgi:hypothetical protein